MIDVARLRVLLVEDNELDARTMLRLLKASETTEFLVVRVGDLASAMAAIDEDVFDCVLLDLSLPDSEGLGSVDALREHCPKAPIVVLTGLDDPATAVRAVEQGAQDYLTKQRIDAELVARSIRYAVARQHSEAQLRSAHDMLNTMHDRERIARDLHDTVIQQLFATGMSLQALSSRSDDPDIQTRLAHAVDGIDDGIRQLREAIFGLHQPPTTVTLLDEITETVTSQTESVGLDPVVHLTGNVDDIGRGLRSELLATIREAVSNVTKHAEATVLQVIVEVTERELVVQIIDNGVGIDRTAEAKTDRLTGRGFPNMERRAADLSGQFRVGPGPGGGTKVEWRASLS